MLELIVTLAPFLATWAVAWWILSYSTPLAILLALGIAALHDVIDAREIRRTENRRIDARTHSAVPSIEEYVEAMGQVALSRPQRAMLTALALADDDGLSEIRLASAAGYRSQAAARTRD